MNIIREEILKIKNSIDEPIPIFHITGDDLFNVRVRLQKQPVAKYKSSYLGDSFMWNVAAIIDFKSMMPSISIDEESIYASTLNRLKEFILDTINRHGEHSNNKLSNLYRFYDRNSHKLFKNDSIIDSLMASYKLSLDTEEDKETCKGIIEFFKLIKERYEAKHGKQT